MKKVKEVNGYEIFEKEQFNGSVFYGVKYGRKYNEIAWYKTLKGAERWCEKH